MIEYSFVRVEPLIDPITNNVKSFVIGMNAAEGEYFAYIDTTKNVEILKPINEWSNEEIRNLCLLVASENNWYEILASQINYSKTLPKLGANMSDLI